MNTEARLTFSGLEFSRDTIDQLAGEQTEELVRDAVWQLDTDIVVLAALEDVIVSDADAAKVKASMVVELANGPISDSAQASLHDRGVAVLPDIVANAGGVIVSYLEWKQNKAGEHWSETEVNAQLDAILSPAINSVIKQSNDHQMSLKEAAFAAAIQRLQT